eukprot:gnl/MRDRNA2_/MRDRNA2_99008_c0_seq1.p1 gnl/MRDRNA2_/MRDRNA2_99008_c0~~gnl/MRDRNA2_/MRDRNA2_99008_c0_seq1.p1  ORF type:complete len:457 (+),score=123.72 gnl/MRDRNA2_/MRDRNA2_99008_c0_seq1:94-1371(+)
MSSGGYVRGGRKPKAAPAPSKNDASEEAGQAVPAPSNSDAAEEATTAVESRPTPEDQGEVGGSSSGTADPNAAENSEPQKNTDTENPKENGEEPADKKGQVKDGTQDSPDSVIEKEGTDGNQETSASGSSSSSSASSSSAQASSSSSASPAQALKEKAGDHPVLIIEYQRLNKLPIDQDPDPEAELVMDGIYWEPTDIRYGDPYPLMEMIVAKPGEHYDNIAHVWNNSWGSLIGRPVDRSVLKMKGSDGEPLYGPEIDADTDKLGWNYGTNFDRMDEARDGGRSRKRMTDVCRSRLWKFGNKMPMPKDWWAMVPKINMPGGGAIQKVTTGTLAIAQQLKVQAVEKVGDTIILAGDSIGEQIKNVGKLVRKSARPNKEEEKEKKGEGTTDEKSKQEEKKEEQEKSTKAKEAKESEQQQEDAGTERK